jgi:hypothetical protein
MPARRFTASALGPPRSRLPGQTRRRLPPEGGCPIRGAGPVVQEWGPRSETDEPRMATTLYVGRRPTLLADDVAQRGVHVPRRP